MEDNYIKRLLKSGTTPMYVFDINELQRRIAFLRENLRDGVGMCFAIKANTFILKEISNMVERLEICSPGELKICNDLKIPSEQFVISGVNKKSDVVEYLISHNNNVAAMTVESVSQFQNIYHSAKKYGNRVKLLLRLTSGNQFGLDDKELENIIKEYKDDLCIDIVGIQYYSGTQKKSLKRLKREIEYIDNYLLKLYDDYGYVAKELEFGPGLPVAYFEEEVFDEKAFLNGFTDILNSMNFKGKIILEIGRSIAASCGYYFTKVVDLKCNHGENYAIVDGGMHQIAYYGQFMAMKHPHIKHIVSGEKSTEKEWNICGSLCTVNDILIKKIPFSDLNVGDVLVFENTGAYCATEGISMFLSRDLPKIALIKQDGSIDFVRDNVSTSRFNTPDYEKR